MSDKYGPLSGTVLLGLNLAAAVAALRLATLGRGLWEPQVEGFARAPVRVAGIIAIVGVAIAFATGRKSPSIDVWIPWTIGCGAVTLLFFLIDLFGRQFLLVKCPGMRKPFYGGLWLTERARDILRGSERAIERGDLAAAPPGNPPVQPPPSARALYCSFASPRDRTRVWSEKSMAASVMLSVFVYCMWNAFATVTVATAATLIALSV